MKITNKYIIFLIFISLLILLRYINLKENDRKISSEAGSEITHQVRLKHFLDEKTCDFSYFLHRFLLPNCDQIETGVLINFSSNPNLGSDSQKNEKKGLIIQ